MKTLSHAEIHPRLLPKTSLRPLALAIALLFTPLAVQALPSGGQVVSGQATIGAPVNNQLTINQTSQKAILNWQDFSIGKGESTHFQQPLGGKAMNRVIGGNPSQILDSLTSTGQVFLINPSGILFGKGAVLNVGGLVASTLDLADTDFLGGNYRFVNEGSARSIVNQGQINAEDGGYIALLAPEVRNEGVISARLGSVAIGAGDRVSLDLDGDGLIGLSVDASALNGRIENRQAIQADGGQVILSARAAGSLAETVINNSGAIRASSVAERNGRIVLEGAHFISQSGSLSASATGKTDGGNIKLAADNVLLAGDIDASGRQGGNIEIRAEGNLIQTEASQLTANGLAGVGGRVVVQASTADADGQVFLSGDMSAKGLMGGQVHVLGDNVTLAAADISATGSIMGGEILLGGGFQGAATGVAHARNTSVNLATTLDASAVDQGAGGRVVVWSDGVTAFAGSALARGGLLGGDGGLIEVSGKEQVYFNGQVNAGANRGLGVNGLFLLDPKNITISSAAPGSASYFNLADPSPAAGDQHGSTVQVFGTSKVLVLSPNDSNAASQAGAVYVYDTVTGAMLSMLTGDQAGDKVGSGGVATLYIDEGDSNYLVKSPLWHESAGAVTWLDAAGSGFNGVVGVSNSLVGSNPNDGIGSGGYYHLDSGNYLVRSPGWGGGKGAVTFLNVSTGVVGEVSDLNSLVGSASTDAVGSGGVYDLYDGTNYNYLVLSPNWDGDKGAATFGSAATGVSGIVSASNSLVGDTAGDRVGSGSLQQIYNYNLYRYFYLLKSPLWHSSAGAVAWLDGGSFSGVVDASNSLVGSAANDQIGSGGYYQLDDGNYVVRSPNWSGGKGAVTFLNVATGVTGEVGSQNSLVGSVSTDAVGSGGIYDLYDSETGDYNYLVLSPDWDGNKGAVTFGSGSTGVSGVVSAGNSFVGDISGDRVGSGGIQQLYGNGDYAYVIKSPLWHSSAGAVSWLNGAGDPFNDVEFDGTVDAGNSLVGGVAGDQVGSGGYYSLDSGNYVVRSPNWGGGMGAVTFLPTLSGASGVVSDLNSLVGSVVGDQVGSGGIFDIYDSESGNYNYLVLSPNWDTGKGAVSFGSGSTGSSGIISADNSFVGDTAGDKIGSGGIQSLYGNSTYAYVIRSPLWHGTAGAATWLDGGGNVFNFSEFDGTVDAGNSLVGSVAGDQVGSGGYYQLESGNYLVRSPNWSGGKGAVTFLKTSSGVTGEISDLNSLVGSNSTDTVGSGGIYDVYDNQTGNYNYLVLSPNWSGEMGMEGAVTFGSGSMGISGFVSASNSYVGDQAGDRVGFGGIQELYGSINAYVVSSPLWHGSAGAATWLDGSGNVFNDMYFDGTVNATNSLVGSDAGDQVGSGGYFSLDSGNYLVRSPNWGGGKGAVTFMPILGGVSGEVSAQNSLVGSVSTDAVGSGGIQEFFDGTTYNYLVLSPNWDGNKGAATYGSDSTGVSGIVSASNSLVGDMAGDRIGSDGLQQIYSYDVGRYFYLLKSPLWHGSAGAVTWLDGSSVSGVLDSTNSLVGNAANDQIGSGGYYQLDDGNYVVRSPNWGGGKGAVTFLDVATGVSGEVSNLNSLVGSTSTDAVGSGGIYDTYDSESGDYNYLVLSPNWDGNKGAVTFGSGTAGVSGVVSAGNSFVGDTAGDRVGSGGIQSLYGNGTYAYLVKSPLWHGSAGAVTWLDGSGANASGVVASSNSLVGSAANDQIGSGGYYQLDSGNYVVRSPNWGGGKGAVTFLPTLSGATGVVSDLNSLVGSASTDALGSGGIQDIYDNGNYNYLVFSPNWNGTFGAVTFGSGTTGVAGVVSSANSFIGTQAGDRVGSGYITTLYNSGGYDYLLKSPLWHGSAGAVTWFDGAGSGFGGEVSASNSLVGGMAGDNVASGGIITVYNQGVYDYIVRSPNWGGGSGMVTYHSGSVGISSTFSGSTAWGYADNPGGDISISPAQISAIANTGTDVLLAANNDITLAAGNNILIANPNGAGGNLDFRAGRSILLNGNISSDGNVYLSANETGEDGVQSAHRDSGQAEIRMAAGSEITTDGDLSIFMQDGDSAGSAGGVTLATVSAVDIHFKGDILLTHNGRLGGNGTIIGNLDVINATLAPGLSPGTIDVDGDLTLGNGSVLSIELGGTAAGEFDVVNVGGVAKLGGALELVSYNGFEPPADSEISFLSGTTSGTFSSLIDPGNLASKLKNLPGVAPAAPSDIQQEIQSVLTEVTDSVKTDVLSVGLHSDASVEQMFETMLNQAAESNVVGSTQQIEAAATALGQRREARQQTLAVAISELRSNPGSADVAECTDGKGEASGACLATRKTRDIDKLIADAPSDTRKRVALLMGNDAYSGAIPALTTPISDVDAIAAKLKEKHGFEVIVLRNAGKSDIIREMNALANSSVVADSIMVMYAGHGYQEDAKRGKQGMGYWIPVDAKVDAAASWISNQDISKLLYAIPARQVMLVSDSCFSGSLTREQRVKAVKGLKREEVLKQRSVLVLSSGGEEPVTDLGHEGHSIFAWNLLKVLDNSQKDLTGFELYRQVHEGVTREFPQQPQYGASIFAGHKGDGDYFLD